MRIREEYLEFARPYESKNQEKYLLEAVRGGWLSTGRYTEKLEEEIKNLTLTSYSLGVNSCTSGLHLACVALGIGRGDQVIVSSMTFCSTVNVVEHTGAEVVFCDIDYDTGVMDCDVLEGLITPKTKAIIAVHYSGNCCNMDRIKDISRRYNLKIIEDCAHSLGSYYKNNHTGAIGDVGVFSFYATKNISTGEGGMIVSNDETLHSKMRILSLHGMDKNAYKRYSENANWKYDVIALGYKYNMSDIVASLGLGQLEEFDYIQAKRNKIATSYLKELSYIEGITPLDVTANTIHSHHLQVIKVDKDIRDRVISVMKTRYKIGTSVHFTPVNQFSYYKGKGNETPVADRFAREIISLPIYPSMELEDVYYVADALKETTHCFTRRGNKKMLPTVTG